MKEIRTFENHCPVCEGLLDAATCISDNTKEEPQGGDITICAHCTAALVFTEDLHLETIDPVLLEDLFVQFPVFKKALEFTKQYNREKLLHN